MGIEPTSSAWKADIIATILYPQEFFARQSDGKEHYIQSGQKFKTFLFKLKHVSGSGHFNILVAVLFKHALKL